MGKASQAKKIKRVQQAGVTRSPGQRRNLAYPALIVAIVVVGALFVFLARESRRSTAAVVPSTEDVWFDAFGVNVCGNYQDQLANVGDGTGSFVVLDNGLIRIAPSSDEEAGEGATFSKFAESVGIQLGENSFTLPGGVSYTTGAPCPPVEGQPAQNGRVALFVWPPQANENSEPRIVTTGIGQVRFTEDGQIMVLGFVPEGQTPALPPTVAALSDPESNGAPATTVAGGAPSTTVAGGEPSTTVAGGEPGATAPATTAPPSPGG
jgi:hypothetical protein